LPAALAVRLEPLIQREIAAVLWRTKQSILVTCFARQELGYLHTYLADRCNPWAISIGHIVKRNATFITTGNASNLGGGAYCGELWFWFSYIWSPEIRCRANLPKKHPDKIHIDCLEFAVALIQLAATITRLEEAVPAPLTALFPAGYPHIPVLLCRTDNMSTKSWASKVPSSSSSAHGPIALLALLLQCTPCCFTSKWLVGHLNGTANLLLPPVLTIKPLFVPRYSRKCQN
jgi:hypothetical protein